MIGHIKAEHRMGRNSLAGHQGDAVNAILAAAGYNFSLPPNWFRQLLWLSSPPSKASPNPSQAEKPQCSRTTSKSRQLLPLLVAE